MTRQQTVLELIDIVLKAPNNNCSRQLRGCQNCPLNDIDKPYSECGLVTFLCNEKVITQRQDADTFQKIARAGKKYKMMVKLEKIKEILQ